ncbi:MAG: hypothetical protein ACOC3D_08295 [Pseudomonadota bacterium]
MLGFLGMFGRSRHLKVFEGRLHALDLHPRLVPDAVKLTVVKLVKEIHGEDPSETALHRAADLVAYCALGETTFNDRNGDDLTSSLRHRLQTALDDEDSLDAKLIMLTLYANLIHPSLMSTYGLRVE